MSTTIFAFEPGDISTMWLSVAPSLVVSAGLQPLRSTVALLVHLMDDQGDVLVNIVLATTSRVDAIEDQLLAGRLEKKARQRRNIAPTVGAFAKPFDVGARISVSQAETAAPVDA